MERGVEYGLNWQTLIMVEHPEQKEVQLITYAPVYGTAVLLIDPAWRETSRGVVYKTWQVDGYNWGFSVTDLDCSASKVCDILCTV